MLLFLALTMYLVNHLMEAFGQIVRLQRPKTATESKWRFTYRFRDRPAYIPYEPGINALSDLCSPLPLLESSQLELSQLECSLVFPLTSFSLQSSSYHTGPNL